MPTVPYRCEKHSCRTDVNPSKGEESLQPGSAVVSSQSRNIPIPVHVRFPSLYLPHRIAPMTTNPKPETSKPHLAVFELQAQT